MGWVVETGHPLNDASANQVPAANNAALRRVAKMVTRAARPVIWIGNGAHRSGAAANVLALAETLNAPVVTTFNGIGAVPTDHPLVFGPVSRMGTALSTRALAGADLVLALGNSLNAVSTTRWKRELPAVVQVDIDPAMIGRYYSDVTTGIVADVDSFTEHLRHALASESDLGAAGRESWIAELTEAKREWWKGVAVTDSAEDGTLSPADVVQVLRDAAPKETLLIPDAGNPGVWSFLWEITQTNTYIKPVGFGNMGFALPAAIAASLAEPDRPVLALIGDGSMGMSLGELETLTRVGGRICIVVLNDSSYGNIRQEQELHFDGRTTGVDFMTVDFATVAEGMGVSGEIVTTLGALKTAVAKALRGRSPWLIDVPIDRTVNAWTYPAFAPYDARKQEPQHA